MEPSVRGRWTKGIAVVRYLASGRTPGPSDADLAGVRIRVHEVEPRDFACVRIKVRESVSEGPWVAVLEGRLQTGIS